jgi:hypothetical protein
MKRSIITSFCFIFFLLSCKKITTEPDTIVVDLSIIAASSPASQIQGQDITSNVRCSGNNLCYKFLKFETKEITARNFEIRAKATYPNAQKGDIVCADAIYNIDTTLKINASVKGQYLLKFYNGSNLFKVDTAQVN